MPSPTQLQIRLIVHLDQIAPSKSFVDYFAHWTKKGCRASHTLYTLLYKSPSGRIINCKTMLRSRRMSVFPLESVIKLTRVVLTTIATVFKETCFFSCCLALAFALMWHVTQRPMIIMTLCTHDCALNSRSTPLFLLC